VPSEPKKERILFSLLAAKVIEIYAEKFVYKSEVPEKPMTEYFFFSNVVICIGG
jgi:hypothetical protein